MSVRSRRAGGWTVVAVFLILESLLLAAYVHVTPLDVRCHDLGSHLAYIGLIEKTHRIPDGSDCWECHQPPAYYALAAAILTLAHVELPKEHVEAGAPRPGALVLQGLGATLGLGAVACWLMTLRLVLAGTYERILASALVTFWPTLAIQACKVGNDSLCYFLASASLWQLVSWRASGRARSLVAAAATAGLAVQAKTSGGVAVAVVLASVAAAAIAAPEGKPRWPRGATAASVVLGFLLLGWAAMIVAVKHGRTTPDYRSLGDDLVVRNTWGNFLTVNLRTLFVDPYAHVRGGVGRDELWNYLFRTSLFGEFTSDQATTHFFAYALFVLAAGLTPFVAAGLVGCVARGLRRSDTGDRELALTLLGSLAFLVVLRLRYPYAPHGDFRFILPVVMPCAAMAGRAIGRVRRRLRRSWPHAAALPGWLAVAFCLISTRVLLVWP